MRLMLLVGGATALFLSGCAYNQSPVVDMQGVNEIQYQEDFAYCEHYAANLDKDEAINVGATNGAAVGAGTGAIAGAFEDGLPGAAAGALIGAIVGGVSGATESSLISTEQQALVLRNCLQHKGYKVYDLVS